MVVVAAAVAVAAAVKKRRDKIYHRYKKILSHDEIHLILYKAFFYFFIKFKVPGYPGTRSRSY